MFELLKKDFEITILWQTCKYKQFSLYECIEFSYLLKQEGFKLEDWLYEYLKDKIELKKTDLLKIDLNKFMDILFDTAFRWFFAKKKSSWDTMPYEAYIMFLSEKFNLDPDEVLKKYTPEQINFYIEWIIYNLNEQTKEWQKKNKIRAKMKELKQESNEEKEKEDLKALLERMDKKTL